MPRVHTGYQLKEDMFSARVDGVAGTFRDVFPGWGKSDRYGIVVDSPLGGIGAALLTQLAVVAHFRTDESRIGRVYPEVYTFHVGGFHGSHAQFDSFPPRKEVVVPDEPAAILEAINDRGITRLAVVDGPVDSVEHHLAEPGHASENIQSVFAYSSAGRVQNADLEIVGTSPVVEENVSIIVDPVGTQDLQNSLIDLLRQDRNYQNDGTLIMPREDGPTAEQRQEVARRRREAVSVDGRTRETYRRVSVHDALGMLHRRGAALS